MWEGKCIEPPDECKEGCKTGSDDSSSFDENTVTCYICDVESTYQGRIWFSFL